LGAAKCRSPQANLRLSSGRNFAGAKAVGRYYLILGYLPASILAFFGNILNSVLNDWLLPSFLSSTSRMN
jgi:hypothetical protein